MEHLLAIFQLASLIVSVLVSRAVFMVITSKLSRRVEDRANFFATPGGSAIMFGLTFVIVWFALSLLAMLGWMLLRRLI